MRVQGRAERGRIEVIDLQEKLNELRTDFNAMSSAVMSRDGLMIAADIPDGVIPETFTIMVATMMGAASTAHSELKLGQPLVQRVTSEKYEMLVVGAGRYGLVVSVVPKGTDFAAVLEKLKVITDSLEAD